MTVGIKVLCVEVSSVLPDLLFEDPWGKALHHLGVVIFVLVHDSGLLKAEKNNQTLTSNREMSKSDLNKR